MTASGTRASRLLIEYLVQELKCEAGAEDKQRAMRDCQVTSNVYSSWQFVPRRDSQSARELMRDWKGELIILLVWHERSLGRQQVLLRRKASPGSA